MGHQQRNANRAYRIEKNKERIGELAEQLEDLGRLMKTVKAEGGENLDEIIVVMDEVFVATGERLRLLERPLWKKLLRKDLDPPLINLENLETEDEMVKDEEKKPEPPATPSHRQVVVDRAMPGPKKKKKEPNGSPKTTQ